MSLVFLQNSQATTAIDIHRRFGGVFFGNFPAVMAMFAPQYNIEINNDGTNGQIGPAALKVVYDLGKKAAADFMQQQARDGGRLSGAYR